MTIAISDLRCDLRFATRLGLGLGLGLFALPHSVEMYRAITIRPLNDMPDTYDEQMRRAATPAGLGLFQRTYATDLTMVKRLWHRPRPTLKAGLYWPVFFRLVRSFFKNLSEIR
jgi:hypothetical protein